MDSRKDVLLLSSHMSRDNRTRRNNTVSPPEGPMMTSALFPLTDLLEEVVHQEEVLWRKSELLLQSLRHGGLVDYKQIDRLSPDVCV